MRLTTHDVCRPAHAQCVRSLLVRPGFDTHTRLTRGRACTYTYQHLLAACHATGMPLCKCVLHGSHSAAVLLLPPHTLTLKLVREIRVAAWAAWKVVFREAGALSSVFSSASTVLGGGSADGSGRVVDLNVPRPATNRGCILAGEANPGELDSNKVLGGGSADGAGRSVDLNAPRPVKNGGCGPVGGVRSGQTVDSAIFIVSSAAFDIRLDGAGARSAVESKSCMKPLFLTIILLGRRQ